MIKAFAINLPKSTDRKKSILKECEKISHLVDTEIFPASDGKEIIKNFKLTPHLKNKILLEDQTTLKLQFGRESTISDKLSPAEVGCALSHLRVYEEIIKRNLRFALVLEDDILINNDLNLIITPLEKLQSKWDIVQVDSDKGIRNFPFQKKIILNKNPLIKLNREGMGILDSIFNRRRINYWTSCYFISKHACQKLLSIGYPVRMPSDYLLGYPAFHGLRLFSIESTFPLALQTNDQQKSTIGSRPLHRIS